MGTFALQISSPNGPFGERALLLFGPNQRGNATPEFARSLAETVTNPFRIAVDQRSGDVAILGSDGTAIFKRPLAAHLPIGRRQLDPTAVGASRSAAARRSSSQTA